jgi:hypothetical protein
MKIRKYLGMTVLSVTLILSSGIVNFASDSNAHSRTVNFSRDVVMAGTTLSAGKYTINWQTHSPEATVQFVQHHSVLASTEGRVEQRQKKYDRNAVLYNTSPGGAISVVEIRFAGSNQVLVFNQ